MNDQTVLDLSRFVVLSGHRWGQVEPYSRIAPFDLAMDFMCKKMREHGGYVRDRFRKPIIKTIVKTIPRMHVGEVLAVVISSSWNYNFQMHGIYRDIEGGDDGLMVKMHIDLDGKFHFREYKRRIFEAQIVRRYWAQAYEVAVRETDNACQ